MSKKGKVGFKSPPVQQEEESLQDILFGKPQLKQQEPPQQQKSNEIPQKMNFKSSSVPILNVDKKLQILTFQENYFSQLKQKQDQDLLEVIRNKVLQINQKFYNRLYDGKLDIERNPKNIVEDAIRDGFDCIKYLQLETQLKNVDFMAEDLISQKIVDPWSVYSHPQMKIFQEEEEQQKKKDAVRLIGRLKHQKQQYEKQLHDKIESHNRIKSEEARKLQELEKEKQDNIKNEKKQQIQQKIQEIQARQQNRVNEIKDLDANYKQLRAEKYHSKTPLFIKMDYKYRKVQEKIEKDKLDKFHDDIKNRYKPLNDQEMKKFEEEYDEKFTKKEQERKENIKHYQDQIKKYTENMPQIAKTYKELIDQEKEDISRKFDIRQQELERLEARKEFADELKGILIKKNIQEKQNIERDMELELQVQIRLDKLKNPRKYLKLVRRKHKDEEKNKEEEITDEQIFRSEVVPYLKQPGNYREKGLDYLQEAKKAGKSVSEKNPLKVMTRKKSFNSELPAIDAHQYTSVQTTKSTKKIDYLAEIRQKYHLDQKAKNPFRQNLHLNSYDQAEQLFRNGEKLSLQARRKEQLVAIKNKWSANDIEELETIDNMYLESIQAKLQLLNAQTQGSVKEEDQYLEDFE